MSNFQDDMTKAFSDAMLYGDGHLIIRNTGSGFEIKHIERDRVTITAKQVDRRWEELKARHEALIAAPLVKVVKDE